MGAWTVDSVGGRTTPFEQGTLFGNNFFCTIKMTYKPSMMAFKEPPILDWHEKFIMIEHHKRERWVFEKNMYEHNPSSNTLIVWPKRYIEAYDTAFGLNGMVKGSSKLVDRTNQPIRKDKLRAATNSEGKAQAVRDYLKSNGGSLLITIHDIPSINSPTQVAAPPLIGGQRGPSQVWEHKERLLLFNCGVLNGALRFKASQYLNVNGSVPKTQWQRSGDLLWSRSDLPLPRGYRDVPPPATVSNPRPANFGPGMVW